MAFEMGNGRDWALLLEGIDQLEVGFTVMGPELRLVAANKRFRDMLNYPQHLSQPGSSIEEGFRYLAERGEYGAGDVETLVRQRVALAGQFLAHRFERVRPDGSTIEVVGNPLPGGGMVTTYTDVTIPRQREQALRELSAQLEQRVEERTAELRKSEQELADKAALLELVISNMNQGISFMNANLELELCNKKFSELLQLPDHLVQRGQSFAELARFNAERGEYGPGDVDALVRERLEVAKKFVPHRFERTRAHDGVTLEVMGIPTPDGGMVSTYMDITERKAAETRIRELNETLERRVAERVEDLSVTIQTLKKTQHDLVEAEKLASLGALVAGVSHELNTPIGNAMVVASALHDLMTQLQVAVADGQLRKSTLADFLRDGTSAVELMLKSCSRAAALVRSFKQVAVDQTSEQRRTFNLQVLVSDVVTMVKPTFRHDPWQIDIDIPETIECNSYPGPIGQVLTNLVQNAVIHAFEGRDHGRIRISASCTHGMVEIRCEDDGRGMETDVLAHIFDPFFTTRLGKGGSGLGLSVSRNIALGVLGGTLTASSTPEMGACFVLTFPAVASHPGDTA